MYVRYLTFNEHLKYHKIKIKQKMTKYQKVPILHHIRANGHTCGSDAITFVESMSSIEVTLTMCHNLGLLRFCLPKLGGGGYKISVPTCKSFQFRPFLIAALIFSAGYYCACIFFFYFVKIFFALPFCRFFDFLREIFLTSSG